MADRLRDKVAIITGGSRGIGAAIAHAFAAEGARVVVASRKVDGVKTVASAINDAHPGRGFARACHTGRPEQISALVRLNAIAPGLVDTRFAAHIVSTPELCVA